MKTGLVNLLAGMMLVLVSSPGLALAANPVLQKPQKIASLNLCTDQLLMQLVPSSRITSVSHLAADPVASNMSDAVRAIGLNHGTAEEIIAQKPDLILAGRYTTSQTVRVLKRLGFTVIEFDPASSIDAAKDNIKTMGALLGEQEKASRMIAEIDAKLEAAKALPAPERPLIFADYGANGYTAGPGSLMADLAHHAGFITLPEYLGRQSSGRISLEQMISARPDLIHLGIDYSDPPSLATNALAHPALQKLIAEQQAIALPARQSFCGTTHMLQTLDSLMTARQQLLTKRQTAKGAAHE